MRRVPSRRLRGLTAFAAVVITGLTVLVGLSGPAAAAGPYQRIRNVFGHQLCLDAENDRDSNPGQNGDRVQLWTCTENNNWQLWQLEHAGTVGGYQVVRIINWWGPTRCLDARADGSTNPDVEGNPVQIWDCAGGDNQLWMIDHHTRQIKSMWGRRQCLDARYDANGNPDMNGDKVQLWTCGTGSHQKWSFSD